MSTNIEPLQNIKPNSNLVVLCTENTNFEKYTSNPAELEYISEAIKNNQKPVVVNQYSNWLFFWVIDPKNKETDPKEVFRKAGFRQFSLANSQKIETLILTSDIEDPELIYAFAEGFILTSYQFDAFKTEKSIKKQWFQNLFIDTEFLSSSQIAELKNICESVFFTRDLVNTPVNYLDSTEMVMKLKQMAHTTGIGITILNKQQIVSLKMGGLMAVNRGSVDPPYFVILEWKPEKMLNSKPYVLVGKGVVFDTGGMNIKTGTNMNEMKSDMGGAAAVAGFFEAAALQNMPLHLIGLLPITDNRFLNNAHVPSDIIFMANGISVEIENTDAEGRLILADGLCFASRYNPELVMDLATLTGAAAYTLGKEASAIMGTASDEIFNQLEAAGNEVHERVVKFPFWDEYKESLRSNVADIKNIGSREGGAIHAGKFLEHFTDYPFVHIDIAGPAFVKSVDSYRGKEGTGYGVRLLYSFFKQQVAKLITEKETYSFM